MLSVRKHGDICLARRWIYYSVFLGMLISNTQSSEENCNSTTADIVITNSQGLKKIEFRNNRNSTNSTSTYQPSPGIIQQGNNVFIRPKFILGSPFSSYKHDYIQNDDKFSMKTKDFGEGTNVVVKKPEKTQPPPIFVPNRPPAFPVPPPPPPTLPPLPPNFVVPHPPPPPFPTSFPVQQPPVFIPTPTHKVPLPIPHPPQFPIALPNLCHSMPCPPNIVPIQPYFPRLIAPLPPTFVVPHPPPPPLPTSFPLPQPPVFVPPPTHKVPLPIPHPPQFPIALPNLCHSMPCPPNIVPIRPYFPRLIAPLPPTFVVPDPPPPPFPTSFPLPQPPVFVPPPTHKVPLPIPHPPQFPIALPNLCHSMPCPPNIVPIRPYFPRLIAPPIVVQRPVYPLVPKPELQPIIVPKLPIQIVVQSRPNVSDDLKSGVSDDLKPGVSDNLKPGVSDHRIILGPCQPCGMSRCAERESPMNNLFNDMVKKFRNMMNDAYGNDTTTEPTTDEPTTTDNNVTDASLCVKGIISERVVPNIVTNNNIKVYITPISPYHVAHPYNYRK